MNYEIGKSNLLPFLHSLQRKAQVIAPVKKEDGASCFQEFNGQPLYLENNTTFSPKKFFLNPHEKLFKFRKKSFSLKVQQFLDKSKKIIFGIRPCDINALNALDEIMIHYYREDPWFEERRKNTLIFGLACKNSCENGFCVSMRTHSAERFDLMFYPAGKNFFVAPGSVAGKKIARESKFFKRTKAKKPFTKPLASKKFNSKNLPLLLKKNFNNAVWKKEADRCLNCTACTQVCPTCYCFYLDDSFELLSENSERVRHLSSCQLQRFTEIAGGIVYRKTREQRLRQFVNHKLWYFLENHYRHLCVGCGRCIRECPTKISITEIVRQIRRSGK